MRCVLVPGAVPPSHQLQPALPEPSPVFFFDTFGVVYSVFNVLTSPESGMDNNVQEGEYTKNRKVSTVSAAIALFADSTPHAYVYNAISSHTRTCNVRCLCVLRCVSSLASFSHRPDLTITFNN